LLLTMRGTPFIYYGEEIGMSNVGVPAHRKRDPVGRDGCRTPMQWDASPGGGFTTASEAWLPLGDCAAINVAKQLDDSGSMLSLYRRMIRLRKTSDALLEGSYRTETNAPVDCLVFHREAGSQHVMVALNFADAPRRIEVPRALILLSTRIGRSGAISNAIDLAPNEGVVLELDSRR
jgi:alpha-glucosidase